jgi:hypothetical protein
MVVQEESRRVTAQLKRNIARLEEVKKILRQMVLIQAYSRSARPD